MADQVVCESLRDPFTNDFAYEYEGPGRSSVMSVDDDSSFWLSQSFGGSTLTELSSVFSMSEDDFDKMASRQARQLFDDIDTMLYERQYNGPPHLITECHEWMGKFPHLRIMGHQMIDNQEEGFHLYPTTAPVNFDIENGGITSDKRDLLVSGEHFEATCLMSGMTYGGGSLTDDSSFSTLEEVLEENGTLEEIFAIDYRTGEEECQKLAMNRQIRGHPPVTPFNCVKDNILSMLFNQVLKEIVPTTKLLLERLLETASEKREPEDLNRRDPVEELDMAFRNAKHLEKNFKSSTLPSSVLISVPEDTPLDGLLTIRSKTLLNRERTIGLDGIAENISLQTVPGEKLNSVILANNHLSERRLSLNRIKLTPLENTRLLEVDHLTSPNLDGLRGHRLATVTSQSLSMTAPKLPPLQNQRAIMSANIPNTNTNINRSMQSHRRNTQRAISAMLHEKDNKVPYREKEKSSLALDFRPSTTQTLYNTDKRNDTPPNVSRQGTSLLPLNIAHRPSTALSAKMSTTPSLVLSGSGIAPRKTQRTGPDGSQISGHLDLAHRESSGTFADIMQVPTPWNPVYSNLSRGKIFKNLQSGSTPQSVHSRLLQLRQSQHKTPVS